MIRGDDLDACVRAFREATATPIDGRATRARVLAGTSEPGRRQRVLGRILLAATVGLLVLTSAAAAWTGLGWRRPAPARPAERRSDHAASKTPFVATPLAAPPSLNPALPPVPTLPRRPDHPTASDGEAISYERAHRVHFFSHSMERALSAWDAYLRAYPHGVFAPEAHFNRALCLVRLGRYDLAAAALKPFATDQWNGYRRQESRELLDWMNEDSAPSAVRVH
jgi:hypothetical protein